MNMLEEFFDWFKSDPFGNTLLICSCLLVGSCTTRSIVTEWGCAPKEISGK